MSSDIYEYGQGNVTYDNKIAGQIWLCTAWRMGMSITFVLQCKYKMEIAFDSTVTHVSTFKSPWVYWQVKIEDCGWGIMEGEILNNFETYIDW